MKIIKVWFDGGAYPTNPGNGYGSYEVQSEGLNHKSHRQEFGRPLTNNQAEYLSLIAALKWLSHNATLPQYSRLEIWSDSKLVCHQLTGRYRVKVQHIKELVLEAQELLDIFDGFTISWHGRSNNVSRFGH